MLCFPPMKTGLVAFFLALALLLSAPLAQHFTKAIPYTRLAPGAEAVGTNVVGDHLQLYYRFWLLGDTLFGRSSPYQNRYEFSRSPDHKQPLASYFFPASLIFLLFGWLGPAAGYNAALLAAFVFSGLAMYALVFHYTRDRAAALIGGTAFAAAPFVSISLFAGHPICLAAFFVPLSILLLERLLLTRSRRTAVVASVVFILLADNDLHALYFVAILCPLFIVRHFAGLRPRSWAGEIRALFVPLLIVTVLAGAAVAFKLSLLPRSGSLGGPSRSLQEIAHLSPHLDDLLKRDGLVVPSHVYPGAAILLVAALGLAVAVLRRRRTPEDRGLSRLALFFSALFVVSLMLAFGPNFPVKAPYLFLYEHLPKFALLRQTSKLILPASFALAVLAGLGWAALRRALPGRCGHAAAAIVLTAIITDGSPLLRPGTGFSLLPPRVEAYERVFRSRPGSRVVNVPIWPGNDAWTSHYLYYATIYRTVMVNGYNPIVPPGYQTEVFQPLASLNAGQIRESQYELLQRTGLDYLIFHEESFPEKVCIFPAQYALDNLLGSPYLELAAREAPVTVFRIRAPEEVSSRDERFRSSVVGLVQPAWRWGEGAARADSEAASGTVLEIPEQAATVRLRRARTTPAGRYLLSVSLKPAGNAQFSLLVRRAADDAVLGERSFSESGAGYRTVTLEFSLEDSAPLYYQLRRSGGEGTLAVDWLYLLFADQQEPLETFEFDELYHSGNTVPDDRASGGRALLLTETDPPGQATRGPYRLYGPGHYLLSARLALPERAALPAETVIGSMVLRNHLDEYGAERDRPENVILAEQSFTAGTFGGGTGFHEVAFPFTLERPAFLSVNLMNFQHGLLADRATVTRVGPEPAAAQSP